MTCRWHHDEEGAVTAMVAVLALALLACVGLAYDGGAIIESTTAARGTAAAAARAGAQQLDPASLHDGIVRLDPDAAAAAAQTLLDTQGVTGTTTVDGDTITVTVTTRLPMRLLPMPDRLITGTATSTATSDVLEPTS